MQAQTPNAGASEATTPARVRPALAGVRLDLPNQCDVCGKSRSTKKHQKCSRIRQQRKHAEWAAFMAEKAAAKEATKSRRYAR